MKDIKDFINESSSKPFEIRDWNGYRYDPSKKSKCDYIMIAALSLDVYFMDDADIKVLAERMHYKDPKKQKEYIDSVKKLKPGETFGDGFEHSIIRI